MWLYWSAFTIVGSFAFGGSLVWAAYSLPPDEAVSVSGLLIFAVISTVLLIRSQFPDDTEQERGAVSGKQAEKEQVYLTDVSADFAALIETIRYEGKANRREERREDRGKALREKITIGLITATLVAIGWQVHEMVRVYGPISEQAKANRDSANANIQEAQAATKQSENSDKSLIDAQRAWVGPSNAQSNGDPVAGKSYDVVIDYQNTGRQPATENIFDFHAFTEDPAQNADISQRVNNFLNSCIDRWQPGGGNVVYPTGGLGGGYKLTETIDASKIDANVADGTKVIIASGCFVYKTFGSYHRSSFCYFFQKGKTTAANWNICQNGNFAD